ncbi:RHS repeat-associated core domain-containing protein [Mucilaginibacter mali]|uniref:RHS repeat-associated core domain-containing protein n=1 Tax=Mucilaginibacter mali TaxID=2740462 RepID=A0A7D4PUV2_9SPHI|nr:DUF6443 domain-containing protein [Mucilaginibacter mali]QKJ31068.1 RHS repeat-associated core domain-containing protein [Mucilaginibacter mali]
MKKHLKPLILLVLALTGIYGAANAQSNTRNYIMTRVPRTPIKTNGRLDTLTSNKDSVQSTIQYIDALGRPVQTVQMFGSPTGKDVVQGQMYDEFGREMIKYQPYTLTPTAAGQYQPLAVFGTGTYSGSQQYNFYQQSGQGYVNTPVAFAASITELSSVGRLTEQGAPGTAWQLGGGHTVRMDYANNNTKPLSDTANTRRVARYTAVANSNGSRTLSRDSSFTAVYAANQLSVTITKDENWVNGRAGTVEEYKDKDGRVVLKRTYNYKSGALETLSTYYVYDDKGMLAYVLPPGANPDATGSISSTTLTNFCYQYRYDDRGRMTEKRIPGKGWDFTVYNIIDQAVATQDSMQRVANKWIFTKYDALGRAVLTGIWDNSNTAISRTSLQTTLSGLTTNLWEGPQNSGSGYTTVAWPTSYTTLLSANYYDTYSNIPGLPSGYTAPGNAVLSMAKGQVTATKTAVLNNPTDMLWSVHYYDDEGKAIKVYQQHYLAGVQSNYNYDEVSTTYDFNDEVTATTRNHYIKNSGNTDKVLGVSVGNTFAYDHTGRKLRTYEQINSGTNTILSQNVYNELSQLYQKNLGGINDPGSGSTPSTLTLGSGDAVTSGSVTKTASGSITLSPGFYVSSGATFRAYISGYLQTITYNYNERGWLRTTGSSGNLFNMELQYETPTSGKQYNGNIAQMDYNTTKETNPGNRTFAYSYDKLNRLTNAAFTGGLTADGLGETIAYDQMGNITSLTRAAQSYGALGYSYSGNQLTGVTGTGFTTRSYAYDGNGNATSDGGSKNIAYNLLNLPQTVTQSSTTLATYTYDAGGQKLRNTGSDGTWDYVNGIVYKNNAISFIQTEEGRAERKTDGSYNYEYNLKDHLGNTRISLDSYGGVARVLQEDEYYSFGLRKTYGGYDFSNNNRYLYNGKEIQTDLANQYDYGARFYDPVIGRWTSVDPLAELGRRWSTYTYGFNNPISVIDPDGMWGDYYNSDGSYYGSDGKNDNKAYVADGVTKNNKGIVTSANNAKELSLSHDKFAISSNVVKHESSGDASESLWIANAANNAKDNNAIDYKRQNSTLYDQLTDQNYSTTPASARKALDDNDKSSDAKNARAAVISVLSGKADPTGGAVLWDGTDFLQKGEHQAKFKQYSCIDIGASDLQKYVNANKKTSPEATFKTAIDGRTSYEGSGKGKNYSLYSTGVQGKSIFWNIGKKK